MEFSIERMLTGSTQGGGCASLCVRSLGNKEGINQHRIHHPLVGSRRWATHEGKEVINHTVNVDRKVWWC
jgi:hypothetical protein